MKKKRQRRDKGSGCIRERKDGRWEARLDRPFESTKYIYGATRKEVENKLFLERAKAPKEQPRENITVGEWLDRWLQLVNENPKNRPATYKLYKNAVKLYIKPNLGRIKLDEFDQGPNLRDARQHQTEARGRRPNKAGRPLNFASGTTGRVQTRLG